MNTAFISDGLFALQTCRCKPADANLQMHTLSQFIDLLDVRDHDQPHGFFQRLRGIDVGDD